MSDKGLDSEYLEGTWERLWDEFEPATDADGTATDAMRQLAVVLDPVLMLLSRLANATERIAQNLDDFSHLGFPTVGLEERNTAMGELIAEGKRQGLADPLRVVEDDDDA